MPPDMEHGGHDVDAAIARVRAHKHGIRSSPKADIWRGSPRICFAPRGRLCNGAVLKYDREGFDELRAHWGNMAEQGPDHFEMRRLESLSNTIFGVAMTLLAYDLPRSVQISATPTWGELYHLYAPRLSALTLSFLIAGIFWFSHQRRLACQPQASRGVVLVNLFFLFFIILLPVTNSLYASYGASNVAGVLYGLHLSMIAALNAWLWWIATTAHADRIRALFALLILLSGTLVAAVAPQYARYVWLLAFGSVLVHRLRLTGRRGEP
jgi:TMEM175 potassium channel family protein